MRIGPFGIWEILVIATLALLLFGPRRLPEMAKGIGQAVREFRKSVRDMGQVLDEDAPTRRTPVSAAPATVQTAHVDATPEDPRA